MKMKRINQTAHRRAMTNPKVRETLIGLRACWSNLTHRQLGDQLSELIDLECSIDGLAKELGKPATNLSRYIKLANQPEEDGDLIATSEFTCAEKPKEQSTTSAGEAARHLPSKIPAKKVARPVIKEMAPAQDQTHTPIAQQTKKIASPSSTRVEEAPVVNGAVSRQEVQVGEHAPKTRMLDSYRNGTFEGGGRLEPEVEQMPPRRNFSAESMKRQGKQ